MGLNIGELLGFYTLLAGLALVIGAAFMVSVIAGMFTAGGLLVMIGGTVVYIANVRAAQAAAGLEAGKSVRSVA
jgi:hypothetical protein